MNRLDLAAAASTQANRPGENTSRRAVLGFPLAAGLISLCAAGSAQAATPKRKTLNLEDPKDQLYIFGKYFGTFADRPAFGAHEGVFYALVNGRQIPLMGYVGHHVTQAKFDPSGKLWIRGKEGTFYTDLTTGEVLESWKNPWTGETVKVFHYLDTGFVGSIGEIFSAGDLTNTHYGYDQINDMVAPRDPSKPAAKLPFRLPWRRIGDDYVLSQSITLRLPNPVDPKRFPKAHTGPVIDATERFSFFASASDLEDRQKPWAASRAGYLRMAPWLPWMRMGQSGVPGTMLAWSYNYSLTGGLEDVPGQVRAYLEKTDPSLLEVPNTWEPIRAPWSSTWSYYAAHAEPEV